MLRVISNLASNHFEELKALVSGADELYIVSPFLMESFDVFFDEIVSKSTVKRITLITTLKDNDPDLFRKADSLHSFAVGCKVNKIDSRVHVDNKLHGKIYIARSGGKPIKGIITSANFTSRGLSHNHEWGVEIDDSDTVAGVIDEVVSASSPALSESELGAVITRIDDYSARAGVPKSVTVNLEVTSLIRKKVDTIGRNLRYFIKPVGHSDEPFDANRILAPDFEEMHFAKRPNSVRMGDILICYAVGTTKLLGYFEVTSEPYIWDSTSRWRWEVESKNLCPNYSNSWSRFENTISSILTSYDKNHPVTFVGGTTLGALQYGQDKIQLTEEFAQHVIALIENSAQMLSR